MTGVLTKADAILPGEYPKWLKILRNKAHPLFLGYYATRQLRTDERENGMLSWHEGRELERKFFLEHPIWSQEDPDRLGTGKLTQALSEQLANLIQERYVHH